MSGNSGYLHPEADLRPWLSQPRWRVKEYTRQRILEGYERVEKLLAECGVRGRERAVDVGCGSGFDSFALACHFNQVVAADVAVRAIDEARRICRRRRINNIRFDAVSAEKMHIAEPAELVFCNLMSHQVPSRAGMLRHLYTLLSMDGCLIYSEIMEGYAPMEIDRAIVKRDVPELAVRLHQLLNGCTGQTSLRFFYSAEFVPLLDSCGFTLEKQHKHHWHGLVTQNLAFCVRKNNVNEVNSVERRRQEGIKKPMDEIDGLLRRLVQQLRTGRPESGLRKPLLEAAASGQGLHFSLLYLAAMTLDAGLAPLIYPRNRFTRLWKHPMPQWTELERLNERFKQSLIPSGKTV